MGQPDIEAVADTADLWVEAIKELDDADRALIWGHAADKLNVLDDVLARAKSKEEESEAKKWKYTKRDGTKVELHTLFSAVVEKVVWFKKLGDSLAALDPAHMAIPWAAFGLSLQIAEKYFERDALAHEGMLMMSVLVPRYTVFERLYLGEESQIKKLLASEIVRLYSRALTFVTKLKRYYEKGTAKRIIGGVWSYDQLEALMKEVKAQQVIVDDLGRLVDSEYARDAANATQNSVEDLRKALSDIQGPTKLIQDGMVDLVKNLKKQQEIGILNWLSPVSYDRYHQGLRVARLKGTGLWMFDQQQYKDWRTSSESSILWLKGQPGTGKSTLVSLLIDSVRVNQTTTQACALAYVYSSRNVKRHFDDEPEAITRNIIKQMSREGPGKPIRGAVVRKYQDLQEQGSGNEAMVFPDTRDLLLQLVDQDTMIFIDGFDECTPVQQKELLELMKFLLEPSGNRVVRILVSSRPSLDIGARLGALRGLSTMEVSGNGDDILRFAKAKANECVEGMKLRNIPVPEMFENELTERLNTGAQGMFLWIKLQAELLSDPKQTSCDRDVLATVQKSPTGLAGLYAAIHERIEGAGPVMRQTAVTMFRWLLCARAPLGRSELRGALAQYLSLGEITEAIILDCCSNLVEVDEGLDTFRFIHTSVRDFFDEKPGFALSERHATVADICLREVVQGITVPQPLTARGDSLQCYVVLYWASHIEQAGPDRPSATIQDALSDLCLANGNIRPWFKQWLHLLGPVSDLLQLNDPFKDKVLQALCSPESAFFAACAFGFTEVVARYRSPRPELFRSQNDMGATGLHLACQYGHLTVAQKLLDGGSDLDAKDRYGETALTRASASGHLEIVELLLGQGANAKVQGRRFGTALQAAALHGHLDIVQRLIRHGVDVEAEGGQFGTALQAASVRGHVQVVKELLAEGADVNAPGGDYDTIYKAVPNTTAADAIRRTIGRIVNDRNAYHLEDDPSWETQVESEMQLVIDRTLDMNLRRSGFGPALHGASRAGRGAVVSELLSAPGVDVNREGGRYGSALQSAAVCGSITIATDLLNAGSHIDSQNGTYGTPLIAACRRSHFHLVKLFLERGASVNIQAGVYGTALQAAARSGNCNIARLLLQQGADPNLVAGTYGTPLQAAARDGFDEMIALLLESGADPSTKGGSFETAVQAASAAGSVRSVQLLVEQGSIIGNALQVACRAGHINVVKFLLQHGADIMTENRGYGTAIQAAAASGNVSLVKFLLSTKEGCPYRRDDLLAALRLAAATGDEDWARSLLGRGVSPSGILMSTLLGDIENHRSHERSGPQRRHPLSSPLECAAGKGHENIVKLFLLKVQEVESLSTSKDGKYSVQNAFNAAAESGHEGITSLFLSQVECRKFYSLDPALVVAAREGHGPIVRLLLKNGAQVTRRVIDAICEQGDVGVLKLLLQSADTTSLHPSHVLEAALSGHVEAVRLLLDHELDVNALVESSRFFDYGEDLATSDGGSMSDWNDDAMDDMDFCVTALHAAALGGHTGIADILFSKGASSAVKGKRMATALQIAASEGHEEMVKRLLDPTLNMDADVLSGRYGTALQAAASKGSVGIVRMLLNRGVDVNQVGGEFGSAIQAAAAQGHEAIVRQLLSAGANADDKRQTGKFGTPLQAAAESGNVEIARLLIRHGAQVDVVDRCGQTPLHRAACYGHESVLALLLEKGANPETNDNLGRSALAMAAANGWAAPFSRLMGWLTKAGGTPESTREQKSGSLLLAAGNGHVTIVETLLKSGCDVGQQDSAGRTALMLASRRGWTSTVRLLLDKEADINHRDHMGDTALHCAAMSGHDATVRLLLARGANVNAQNRCGSAPLHFAIPELEEPPALPGSDKHKVLYILAHHPGIQLDVAQVCEETPLHRAALIRNPTLVAILVDSGANIEARDFRGRTPFHHCVLGVYDGMPSPVPALEYLVNKGADIHAKDNEGHGILQAALAQLHNRQHTVDTREYLATLGITGSHNKTDAGECSDSDDGKGHRNYSNNRDLDEEIADAIAFVDE
ncbi:uncharacterized protein DSM5745_09764 [Aspergillus mulundensis]|uniref:NACHT domain-containing protein n=1 Tax=Aspergillus mulundensis TaxID=1810919 RepID=A0A3D8QRB1_9EURO|nr:hypothetical protein DSM5745_09764 [Aspergillus mulundensis]RDW64353.1 hypothetical protein DSM5745_09764 [Aspergillus mulundensis]